MVFSVIYGHIQTGQDFFTTEVPECDYIINNPPYSLKSQMFKQLYEIEKPFAMLINFQGMFDQKDRFDLFKQHKVELLWFSPRVSYNNIKGERNIKVPFQSCYLCSGICHNQLEFDYIKDEGESLKDVSIL